MRILLVVGVLFAGLAIGCNKNAAPPTNQTAAEAVKQMQENETGLLPQTGADVTAETDVVPAGPKFRNHKQ